MGLALLALRLAARDLLRRPAQAALLLLAITTVTTMLTTGLVMHDVSAEPYQRTREATRGPDVIASVAPLPDGGQPADRTGLAALAEEPDVTGHSGPYPYTGATVGAHGVAESAFVQGRDTDPAVVDQPYVTDGTWVRAGGAVIEASFAEALGVGVGDDITVNGESFRVAGIAVSAASGPYPKMCFAPCADEASSGAAPEPPAKPSGTPPSPPPAWAMPMDSAGLVWLTDADLRGLVPAEWLSYVVNLTLTETATTQGFVDEHYPELDFPASLTPWQAVLGGHAKVIEKKRTALLVGSWLLCLIALASITVLVGARTTDQVRRVGLLKAVGSTPSLVAAILLAEYVAVTLIGTACGLIVGRLAAPLLAESTAGLIGSAGAVPFTLSTIGVVTAVALGVATAAAFAPALRASRTSTIDALADAARPPRRTRWLITVSSRLPVSLLLAVRVAARRPLRTLLNVVAITITVTGIVGALSANAHLHSERADGISLASADLNGPLLLLAVMLVVQAGVTVICIAWATALDARYSSALARALGATPGEVSSGLSVAQVLPALTGALLGLPGGIALAEALDDDPVTVPPPWQLTAVAIGIVLVTAALTHLPARITARHPAGTILQRERSSSRTAPIGTKPTAGSPAAGR